MSEIIVQPNPLKIATGVQGLLEVGGVITYPGKPQGCYPEDFTMSNSYVWTTSGDQRITKVGTTDNSGATRIERVPRDQPLWIRGRFALVRPFHQTVAIALFDDLGFTYSFGAYSNANDSGGWHWIITARNVEVVGAPSGIQAYVGEDIAIQTTPDQILFMRQRNGFWQTMYVHNITDPITEYRMHYNLFEVGSVLTYCQQRIDDANIPVTTNLTEFSFVTNPQNFVSEVVDSAHYGITAPAVGAAQARLYIPRIDLQQLVSIESEALFIRPKTLTSGIVLEGQVVEFETNGGLGGIFQASGGTILAGLKWQAPFTEGVVDFTYQVGNVTAHYELSVVKPLSVVGVDEDGFYPDVAQGERVSFKSTCPSARYNSPTHPYLVTPRGEFIAPTDAQDAAFGEKIATIKVQGCGQIYYFKIRVQPMYPTPKFCGATPISWLKNEPDFLPNSLTMSGGTSQVKNRNREGILIWDIAYELLKEDATFNCTCDTEDLTTLPAGHLNTCLSKLATAKRLSDFYRQVSYTDYFTVVDYHTGEVFKYVRLIEFRRKHTIYNVEQARTVRMRWEGNPLLPIGLLDTDEETPDTENQELVETLIDGQLTYGEPDLYYGSKPLTYI